jgi:hypothetical protein
MDNDVCIRSLTPEDDFEKIDAMLRAEVERRHQRIGIYYEGTKHKRDYSRKMISKEMFFNGVQSKLSYKGFIVEASEEVKAVMIIRIYPSGNGFVEWGYIEGGNQFIDDLLRHYRKEVTTLSDARLYKMIEILPGQIRNKEIAFWENRGFVSDSYYNTFIIHHNLENWSAPDDLDITGVFPATDMEIDHVLKMLEEDDELSIAENVRLDYSGLDRKNIILTMKLTSNQEIAAIAYYAINRHADGRMGTNSLGIHVRPHLAKDILRQEIKRFIQCVLSSMKQLNFSYAGARMSSRSFQAIIELSSEGFELSPFGHISLQLNTSDRNNL